MNYLVTGGAGFIGSVISKKLLDRGDNVTIIDNLSTGYISNIPKNAIFIEGDVSDNNTIKKLNGIKFDAILHIAGQSSGEISFEDPVYDLNCNTTSTLRLLDYAKQTGCRRFIYASTMSVYGEQKDKEQFSEMDIPNPKSFYAVGKLASEQYIKIYKQQYNIDYTVLRYFNVYGAGQNLENLKQGMVSIYLKQFMDDKFDKVEVKGSLLRFRDVSYVDDIADVTIESINNQEFYNEIINVGSGIKTTVGEMIKLMQNLLKSKKEIIILDGTPGDQFGIYANNSKLKKIYNKEFIKFEDGLKMMIEWVKNAK
jgi:UDP-glucose 4-epimerase